MSKDDKFPRQERRRPPRAGGRKPGGQSLSEEIMELDGELLKLLAHRSLLMNKLRKGKAHASTPGIVKSEKEIRSAWERQTGRLSDNPRLSRQLFSLIQDLDIQPGRAEDDYTPFNLSPSRQAVNIDVAGPGSAMIGQLWLALAASGGRRTRIKGIIRSAGMLSLVRAFEQTGVHMVLQGDEVVPAGNQLPDYHGKAIFLGNDLLTLYIFMFFGLATPGKLRFTGGPALKEADLSPLARFLPTLGARLVSVLPGSKGLPVNMECSGEIPDELTVPGELPLEAVLALLLAALTWRRRISISLADQTPERQRLIIDLAKRAFMLIPGLGQALEKSIDYNGYTVSDLDFPAEIVSPLDPALCAIPLAMPIFTGGSVKLSGKWSNLYQYNEIIKLLDQFGLNIKGDDFGVSCAFSAESAWPDALEADELSEHYHPLFWVLNARLCHRAKGPISIRRYPRDANLDWAEEFLSQAGFRLERLDGALRLSPLEPTEFKEVASRTYGWPCPSSCWGLALSLAAFMRPNLKLSNPNCVNENFPDYWYLYNKLPTPQLKIVQAAADKDPERPAARRRIKTDSVSEPEVREDYERKD